MVNEVLSQKLQVEPLKPGAVAVYRVIGAGRVDKSLQDENGNYIKNSPNLILAGQAEIWDLGQNKRVVIKSRVRKVLVPGPGGIQVEQDRSVPIDFGSSGMITVNEHNQDWYFFLERHPRNASNPFRDKRKAAKFERVKSSKETVEEEQRIFEDRLDMGLQIREAETDWLIGVGEALKKKGQFAVNTADVGTLRVQLLRVNEKKGGTHALMIAAGDKRALTEERFKELERLGILTYDQPGKKWYFNKDGVNMQICGVGIKQDPYLAIEKHLHKNTDESREHQALIGQAAKEVFSAAL
jgi:hypothetical protein